MSLRTFHIIFVTIATLLFIGIAVWIFKFSGMDAGVGMYGFGLGCSVVAIVLPIYGILFYKKIKKHNL